jgi:uncharacterized protein (DUF1015 family)
MPALPELGGKEKTQTGLVCVSSVEDYFNDIIKKHEFTRPEKEKDRIDHMLSIKAQTGNVFLAYRDVMEVNAIINGWKATQKPIYDFKANDGIQHTVWIIDRDIVINSITQLFATKFLLRISLTVIIVLHPLQRSVRQCRIMRRQNFFDYIFSCQPVNHS